MRDGHTLTPERKLAAVMLTDIAGYAALMSKDEQKTLSILEKNRTLQKSLAAKHNGEFLKEMGDGTLLCFQSALDAVRCAMEIQESVKDDPEINLRIGIHLGDIVFQEGDIFGDGVNVASRIEKLAPAGGICISSQVHETIKNQPGIAFLSMGERRLKHVDQPVKIYALTGGDLLEPPKAVSENVSADKKPKKKEIAWGAALVLFIIVVAIRLFLLGKSDRIDSIAVLPLANLSEDPQQVFFCDGITDALITELGKIEALGVTSRTSIYRYRNSEKTVPEIARDLKVDAIMEGTVLKAGSQIRIDVKLINAAEDRQIWANQYERGLENVLVLQSEVVRDIVRRIKIAVTPEERTRITSREAVNPDAHEAYLHGKHLLLQRKTGLTFQAIDYFQEAIEIDSTYAYGYLGLAQSYADLGFWNTLPSEETWLKALSLAHKALTMDETLAEAHATYALAIIKTEYDWAMAEQEYLTALDINPNSAEIHMRYAQFLYQPMLRFEEALAHIETAQKFDPFWIEPKVWNAWIEVKSGNDEVALRMMERLNELNPDHPFTLWGLALVYMMMGNYELAIKYVQETIQAESEYISNEHAVLSYLYIRTEQAEQAQNAYKQLDALSDQGIWISPVIRSFYHIGLGEYERAMDWIERGYENHDTWIQSLRTFFIFDDLHDHPRFQAILKKMGLNP